MNNELSHYGVLGMKWGVRRYQNKDGTLTSAGKKRYDRDIETNLSKKKDSRVDTSKPTPNRWVIEDIDRTKKVVDSTSRLSKDLQNLERDTKSRSKKNRPDLSNMSDKEMRDKINRELLEQQYDNVFNNPSKTSKGREVVSNTLKVAGNTLAVTSSALAIALAIKELKG